MLVTPKKIGISNEVYNKLLEIKGENENFSDLILRLVKSKKSNLEKSFGTWKLTKEEKEIWNSLTSRGGRKWNKATLEEFK